MLDSFFKKKVKRTSGRKELIGARVMIIATDGFEASELFVPKEELENAGAEVLIVSPKEGRIRSWSDSRGWGKSVQVNLTLFEAFEQDFDFLVLPGGVINPDKLRNNPNVIALTQSFINKRRPIAAICHGVQTLIETGSLEGRTLTSWPSLRTDLINAGAQWIDEEVVVDNYLITSRKPDDLKAFCRVMIEQFALYRSSRSIPDTESYILTV